MSALDVLYKSFYRHELSFLSGKYLGMKLLGQKYVWFYKKLPDLFPKWLCCFAFPPTMDEDSNITDICMVSLFMSDTFWCAPASSRRFNHTLLVLNDVE